VPFPDLIPQEHLGHWHFAQDGVYQHDPSGWMPDLFALKRGPKLEPSELVPISKI